jgi:hypothetical protein
MDKEKLVVSLFMACHHPGGKKRASPGPRVALVEIGTTSRIKFGKSFNSSTSENTPTCDVFPNLKSWLGSLPVFVDRGG